MFAPANDTLGVPPPIATARPLPIGADAVERGSRLFASRGCFACHGLRAEGHIGPRLAGTLLAFDDVLRQVRSPRTLGMPAFLPGSLSDDGVAEVYVYLRSLPVR